MVSHSYVSKRIKSQKSYQRALHFHDAFELFFSLNDGSKFFLADRIYDIHRGVVVLIPEGTLHRKVNPDNLLVDSYAIHFPSAFLKENSTPKTDLYAAFGENLSCFQLPEEEINLIKPLFDRCMKPPGENFGGDICRNIHLIELLLTIYPFIPTVSTIHSFSKSQSGVIPNVIHYINEHITEPMSLDLLANQFFVSKYSLCHQFKKETSFTIVQYINSSRIRMACSLIREEQTITNIGARVGFSNSSHFINTFRTHIGVTPRNYLKRYTTSVNAPIFGNYTSQ